MVKAEDLGEDINHRLLFVLDEISDFGLKLKKYHSKNDMQRGLTWIIATSKLQQA